MGAELAIVFVFSLVEERKPSLAKVSQVSPEDSDMPMMLLGRENACLGTSQAILSV